MKYYDKSIVGTLEAVRSRVNGLTVSEARQRLRRYGPNKIKVTGIPLWQRLLQPFANVMVLVLVAAGALSWSQGNVIDTIIIFAVIFVSAAIDWAQQYSTERILRKLHDKEIDKVEVLRSGESAMVAADSLVVGDIILLSEGQKVPADARVIEASNLHIDESMLTGESLSVRKTADTLRGDREVYDQSNMLFSGSFVVTGSGQAVVVATANNTEFGKLAQLTRGANMTSPIQEKIDKLIRQVVVVIFILALMVLILQLVRGQSFIDALQFVLAFTVSAVPESLPIAITAVLAMGMKRMAAHKALVRNMRAIENIGLTTVIATDKTGTLTQNKLSIQETWSPRFNDKAFALQASFALNSSKGKLVDPLDQALVDYLHKKKISDPAEATNAKLMRSLPFDYNMAMSGNVWQFGRRYAVYLKGAPEKVLARCQMTELQHKQTIKKLTAYTNKGYRVIAYAKWDSAKAPTNWDDIAKSGLEFLGFTAVADQLRPRVELAVRSAKLAGVKVCMITGDHKDTALHIAQTIGIADDSGQVYDSQQLAKLTPAQLASVVETTRVYARVTPGAKHTILTQLNKNEITAMTGDGVNDVPALTQAHVGIAMGSGASIAKDASDMVLLDNNFRSIVTAIKEGRTIIANIRRMLVYLLATNAGEAAVTMGALLLGMPLPLVAVQILWINLATDTFMVIPLGIEPSRGDVMRRNPDKPNAPLLNKYLVGQMIVTALSIAVISLATFAYFDHFHDLDYARSAVFVVMVVIQWVNALTLRGIEPLPKILQERNKAFWWALSGTAFMQLLLLTVPALRDAMHLSSIHSDTVVASIIAVIIMTVTMELYKTWMRRRINKKVERY